MGNIFEMQYICWHSMELSAGRKLEAAMIQSGLDAFPKATAHFSGIGTFSKASPSVASRYSSAAHL
jgi:hypothetical protein